jgi:pescadillo
VKGIYYQSEIMGQTITYLVPFKYPASLPGDVDYRVLSTFLDFYMVLLKFVNYKLYTGLGLTYPPVEVDQSTYQGYEFPVIPQEANKDDDEKYQIDDEFKQK